MPARIVLAAFAWLLVLPAWAAPEFLSFQTEDEANSMEIYQKASAAVVHVTNTALRRSFFSRNVEEIPRGAGTGFIWDKNGLVVTNFHVIQGANRIIIELQDRSEWDAEVIGIAPEKDLAVLRIKAPPEQLTTETVVDTTAAG